MLTNGDKSIGLNMKTYRHILNECCDDEVVTYSAYSWKRDSVARVSVQDARCPRTALCSMLCALSTCSYFGHSESIRIHIKIRSSFKSGRITAKVALV